MKKRVKYGFAIVCACFLSGYSLGQERNEKLFYPVLVQQFLQMQPGFTEAWPSDSSLLLRKQLLHELDTSFYNREIQQRYHYAAILQSSDTAGVAGSSPTGSLITDAIIAMGQDIYKGLPLEPPLMYDVLTKAYADTTDHYLLTRMLTIKGPVTLHHFFTGLLPADTGYALLKQEWETASRGKNKTRTAWLETSMNTRRWVHHFRFSRYILVNLTEARLYYFEKDSLVLSMKTVVGKPATPTPRFATWCRELVLYPYWYVPSSIVFNEYLPLIRLNPGWLDANNMQVIDAGGRVVDPYKPDWSRLGPGHFPYQLRQASGCDNALGVLKFTIESPFGVYLHDTNRHTAFLSGYRYYSHGCIRLEEPLELGNRLLDNRLDTSFLKSCFKEQKPVTVRLEEAVPVLVLYIPAIAAPGQKLKFGKDVYKLLD